MAGNGCGHLSRGFGQQDNLPPGGLDSFLDARGHARRAGRNSGAGGFAPLACHEDVALVRALQAWGARIAWSAAPRVTTSARRSYRACEGFGATLERLALPSLHAMGAAA